MERELYTEDDYDTFRMYGISDENFLLLENKLKEKHRFYHNESHIKGILKLLDDYIPFSTESNLTSRDRRVLKMAAYYHDAVYDPRNIGKNLVTGVDIKTN